MPTSREEQLRNNRRVARQLVGAAVVLLVIIGLFTVFGWAMRGLRSALDDTAKKESYADKLYGLVMFDVLPFDDVTTVDQNVFRQAAIWGTVYQIQKSGGFLDEYERDESTGSVILPKLQVDTYLANLLGPDYTVIDGAFETTEMNYLYSEEKQGYLVPVTGSVGLFTPQVERITTKGGKTYVTVGYVPTLSSSKDLTFTTPTEPTKYMDYVFARGSNRQWYLTALQESEMQVSTPAASASSDSTQDAATNDPQALVESNLEATLINPDTAITAEPTPAPDNTEGEQPADTEAQGEGDSAAPDANADAAPESDTPPAE
ncbi:MAG: hypothetical protein PHO10_05585 [Gemmiger sp.]|nr:hypothetical protein [Gemmiger sp.]